MVHPCQIKSFRMKMVDLYTRLAVNNAPGKQLFKLLKSQMQVPMRADRSGTRSALAGLILV